jgi:transcriptional regulator with XRE-family HTH domain
LNTAASHTSPTSPQPPALSLPGRSFYEYLQARRKAAGLSWQDLGRALAIDDYYLARQLRCVTPSPDLCLRVAAYFGDAPAAVLQLANWLEPGYADVARFKHELDDILRNDPNLREFCNLAWAGQAPHPTATFWQRLQAKLRWLV